MFHRFAVMVAAAAFAASSVAPAQVPSVSTLVQQPAIQANDVVTPVPAEPLEAVVTTNDIPSSTAVDDTADETPDRPAVRYGATLADAVAANRSRVAGSREIECLAVGIYFESKSEPLAGQFAVGNVIANRAESGGRFPPSYCGVLFQRGQFSFVHGKGWPPIPTNGAQWKTAVAIAKLVDGDQQKSNIGKALFFHARRVSPGWKLTRVASIGNHVFYR